MTSWTTERDNAGNVHNVPCSGFRIEERLGPVGGLTAALATCRGCETNARTELGIDVAGCFGHLDIWPDSEDLDRQLWGIIDQRSLEQRLRAAFPVTTPLWYGFWINSPLRRVQAEFLHELLDAACDHDDPQDKDVRHFLKALVAAVRWELPVHDSMAPLGHTDFGMYTVFPHCSRCKANAPVGRWKESYPTEPYQCWACGHTFNLDEHHSSERDEYDWEADRLERRLGEAGYEPFVRAFLLHRGCSPEQADEVIDNKNNGPLLRRIKMVRQRRDATLKRLRQEPAPKPDETRPGTFSITPSIDPMPQRSFDPALTRSSSGSVQPPSSTPGPSVGMWERTNSRIEGRRSQGIDGGSWPVSSPLPPNSRLKNFITVTPMCRCRFSRPSDTHGGAAVQGAGVGDQLAA